MVLRSSPVTEEEFNPEDLKKAEDLLGRTDDLRCRKNAVKRDAIDEKSIIDKILGQI